jgi:exodeoxyribonuclease VII large subunit
MEQLGLNWAPQRRVYSVAEVTGEIRGLLEAGFSDVWITGEVSNVRAAPSGHYYFTLKDRDAQLKAVCFRQNALYLKIKPQNGLAVIARGRISVYEARGEYQLYVDLLEPQGFGALQLAFEQLKKQLASEGLFDDERKRPLPSLPRRIGIVTSPAGAAIADMLRILERRFDGLHILLYPAQVQGDGAARQIAAGVRYFSDSNAVDVVIVGRGGGSLEDLWAFNEEIVARAIAECEIPVISAVGHQTDFTIADFVADLRAPTPSAAAELVVRKKEEFVEAVGELRMRLTRAIRYKFATAGRDALGSRVERAAGLLRHAIASRSQQVDELTFSLRGAIVTRLRDTERKLRGPQDRLKHLDLRVGLARHRARLDRAGGRLAPLATLRLERGRTRLESLRKQLAHLSPVSILDRGYAIVQAADGSVIRMAEEAGSGDALNVRLHRGRLGVRVESVESAEPELESGGGRSNK